MNHDEIIAFPHDAGEPELAGREPRRYPDWPDCYVEIVGRLCGRPVSSVSGAGYILRQAYRADDHGRRREGHFWCCDVLVAEYYGTAASGEFVQQIVPVLIPTAALPAAEHRQRVLLRARIWREAHPDGTHGVQVIEAFAAESLPDGADARDRLLVQLRGRVSAVTSLNWRHPWGTRRFHRATLQVGTTLQRNLGRADERLHRETSIACQVADDVAGRSWLLRRGNHVVVRGRLTFDRPRGERSGPPSLRVEALWLDGERGQPLSPEELVLLPEQIREHAQRREQQRPGRGE